MWKRYNHVLCVLDKDAAGGWPAGNASARVRMCTDTFSTHFSEKGPTSLFSPRCSEYAPLFLASSRSVRRKHARASSFRAWPRRVATKRSSFTQHYFRAFERAKSLALFGSDSIVENDFSARAHILGANKSVFACVCDESREKIFSSKKISSRTSARNQEMDTKNEKKKVQFVVPVSNVLERRGHFILGKSISVTLERPIV